jgi:putative transposase
MARKCYTPDQIIRLLRHAEVLSLQGRNVSEISREIGVTENTYYRWRKEYGGMRIDQAKRLREIERENTRLRRAVADLTLDHLILKEAAEGSF